MNSVAALDRTLVWDDCERCGLVFVGEVLKKMRIQPLGPSVTHRIQTRGRGAVSNRTGRYENLVRDGVEDTYASSSIESVRPTTTLTRDLCRNLISRNDSPDITFEQSANAYRGCEHGCVYCYARPTHAWLGLSPGLDFETRLFYKPQAPRILKEELARPGYRCSPLALGTNTDPYQPVERGLRLTRRILEVLDACSHPVLISTKSKTVERDLDVLTSLAHRRLVSVAVSITTLDRNLARNMEPRATSPERRLETIRRLSAAGIPVSVLVAPVIPMLTDVELERILERAAEAGARSAAYVLLRLPLEVKAIFAEWLYAHYPGQVDRILYRVRDTRGGKAYDATFGQRMHGTGYYADIIAQRFALAHRRLGFSEETTLDSTRFRPPSKDQPQLSLF